MKSPSTRSLVAAVLGASLALHLGVQAAQFAGIEVPPPPPAEDVSDVHWGTTVRDPYRRLEDLQDPKVQAWMRAQADATAAILGKIPGRRAIAATLADAGNAAGGSISAIASSGNGRLFFLRRNPGENLFKLVWRDGPDGADHVLVDPEAGNPAGAPLAVMSFSPSPDGSKLAYSVQRGGLEIGELHVVDVVSGRALVSPIDRVRWGFPRWLGDGSGLFFLRLREGFERLPATERFGDRTTHLLSLHDGAVRPVFGPSLHPGLGLSPELSSPSVMPIQGTKLAAAIVTLTATGEGPRLLFVAELEDVLAGKARWRRVIDEADDVRQITWAAGSFYLLSAKDAPNLQVLRLPVTASDLSGARTVVPAGEHPIQRITIARDGLYFMRREEGRTALFRLAPEAGARPVRIALPVAGHVMFRTPSPGGLIVSLADWTTAAREYRIEDGGRRVRALSLAQAGTGEAPADLEVRELQVPSHDGTLVPVSILARKGIQPDKRHPTLVFGYGAYGEPAAPAALDPRILAWARHGGIWAVVHARGGGAFGDAWHRAGRKATKPNTWKDAIAAAEWLVREGWTSPARMGILGASAGGILVGRAITERPDLFAAAAPVVGMMDMLRFETTANGPINVTEFGSVKVEEEFRALLAMSSYHAVRDGVPYPAVMAMVGTHDIRVEAWQSAKFVARLAAATTGGKPVLLRVDEQAGHTSSGIVSIQLEARWQTNERIVDMYTFMLWQFGVPEFQPR